MNDRPSDSQQHSTQTSLELMEIVDRRLEEHNRRWGDKLESCRGDVDDDMSRLTDMLQRVEEALATQNTTLKELQRKAETVEISIANLCELGVVWSNYKGWRNTMGALFGPPTWKIWLVGAVIIYVISNGHLPPWAVGNPPSIPVDKVK